MQDKKQPLEPDMEQWTCSKLGKEYIEGIYCHPAYYLYTEYIMWNARMDELQAGIKISRRNINNLGYADETTPMAESEEELESLDEGERGEWKSWLKRLSAEEFILSNCGAREDFESPLNSKDIISVNPKRKSTLIMNWKD